MRTSVPVLGPDNLPLMPTKPARARKWISVGKAVGFFKDGIFCVRLTNEPKTRDTQKIVVGIDPGSKMEGITVRSRKNVFINIQLLAITHVKKKMESRRNLRRNRRQRKTRNRKPRSNNKSRDGFIPPSTKARWDAKLRMLNILSKMFPITEIVVEDIFAKSKKGCKNWNSNFSVIKKGKTYFYKEIRKKWVLGLYRGYETKEIRDRLNLRKSKEKMSFKFDAHCIDSYAMSTDWIGGKRSKNKEIYKIKFIEFKRRSLHYQNFKKGGVRPRLGGTMTFGIKKGSVVFHPKYGVCLMGGWGKRGITLCCRKTYNRITRNAKAEDITFKSYNYHTIEKMPCQ